MVNWSPRAQLSRKRSSRVTRNTLARWGNRPALGMHSPRSHACTEGWETPRPAARSACVRSASSRARRSRRANGDRFVSKSVSVRRKCPLRPMVGEYPILGYSGDHVQTLRVAWRDEKKSGAQAHLGSLLRAARERSGIRQAELARQLGMPQSFVSKYESGERRLDIFEVKLICAHVGISLPDLDALLDNRTSK